MRAGARTWTASRGGTRVAVGRPLVNGKKRAASLYSYAVAVWRQAGIEGAWAPVQCKKYIPTYIAYISAINDSLT